MSGLRSAPFARTVAGNRGYLCCIDIFIFPYTLMNARKELIPVRSSQGVKTRMVVMIARVKMDLRRQLKERVQVIHYTSFYFT